MMLCKRYILFPLVTFLFFALFIPRLVTASTSDGTIDTTYRYAWGENAGWVDFGSTQGNIHVTDTAVTGYAYGENIGWILLTGITNDREGNLSGYAWGENAGWINFSSVTIGSDGIFAGNAYGENIGWIVFGTGSNKVVTDWRPVSTRTVAPTEPTPVAAVSTGSQIVSAVQTSTNSLLSNSSAPTISSRQSLTQNLSIGIQSADVKTLQTLLRRLGFLTVDPTGYFGPMTQMAVKKYQIAKKLPPVGTVGALTRASLNSDAKIDVDQPSVSPVIPAVSLSSCADMSLGANGECVKLLQKFLNANGLIIAEKGPGSPGNETTSFGPATKDALVKFQVSHQIVPSTGAFGQKTKLVVKSLGQ